MGGWRRFDCQEGLPFCPLLTAVFSPPKLGATPKWHVIEHRQHCCCHQMEITLVPRGSWPLSCLDNFAAAIRVPNTAHPGHSTSTSMSQGVKTHKMKTTWRQGNVDRGGRKRHTVENRSDVKGSGKTTSVVCACVDSPKFSTPVGVGVCGMAPGSTPSFFPTVTQRIACRRIGDI